MAHKFNTRFSPSIVRAALSMEALVAVTKVDHRDKNANLAHAAFSTLLADYLDRTKMTAMSVLEAGKQVELCMHEMAADRVKAAKERRARQLRHELEREQSLMAMAA